MTDTTAITPAHPRWQEFIEKLGSVVRSVRDCDTTLRHTRQILATMGWFDIEASVANLESRGGFCDCEIFLNIVCADEP